MQRNYLRGLLICLIPCLVAAVFAARPEKYRLGIDLAGGTSLIYEINLERTKLRKATEKGKEADTSDQGKDKDKDAPSGLTGAEMNELAAQIKRRIDPTDIKNVTVRPLGDRQIEIILPTGGSASGKANLTAEDIEEIKKLISQMGVLEFRILANGPDDEAGLLAARQAIEDAAKKTGQTWVNPATKKEEEATGLQLRAAAGLPPPPPLENFSVNINDTKEDQVKYAWVELGKEERESLGLSNSNANQGGMWTALAVQRDRVFPYGGDMKTCRMLLYSRDCVGKDQLDEEAKRRERLKRDNPLKTPAEIEEMVNPKLVEYFVLTRISPSDRVRVGGDITLTASVGNDRSYNRAVDFRFNSAGGRQFGTITRRNKPSGSHHRSLAIMLDERVVSAPSLNGEITTSGQITGGGKNGFEKKSADRLVQILRSGALSAELREKPVSENEVGPTLGADTIRRGTLSIALAFVAVLVFMVIYYRFAGLVACIALFANLLLTIGFMVAVNAAFTLPGLAGLVLTLGMAVDANVLIYERLREERNKGANLATAIRNGYDRAFLTIIDTHLTSIFTAIVLYTFGTDQLKGFAITLTVGLVISLFTSLYMTRLMFDFWLHKGWLTQLKMMRLFERPTFNPMKFRWFFFPFTGALTIFGLALFLHRGEQSLDVDFRGGTVFVGKFRDGEERGPTQTPDGKAGLAELLSEDAQKARLTAKEAVWENEPKEGAAEVNTWVYTITYTDGAKATVTLTEKPGGPKASKEEMAADVVARASNLSGLSSPQQRFLSGDNYGMGKSKLFTVSTTENQKALVQASLNRLLSDENGKSLLDAATMTYEKKTEKLLNPKKTGVREDKVVPVLVGKKIVLTFDKPTSKSYVAELIKREFLKTFGYTTTGADAFSLDPDETTRNADGKYTKMTLDLSPNQELSKLDSDDPAFAENREIQRWNLADAMDSTKKAFDGTPEPEGLSVVGGQLAADTRTKALFAIVLSWLAILLYLWFRFGNWTFGLAAVICLVHDLCFTLGAIAFCHYLHLIPGIHHLGIQDFRIDLAAVAALLTLVGYSVNEIIVNFARIREVRGKNPKLTPQMINDSVNQTLSRTILTSMTVFLVSIVLYAFGGEGVHLFAFVMVVGVLVSTYSSIFVASPLLLFLGEGHDTAGATTEEQTETDKEEGQQGEDVVEG